MEPLWSFIVSLWVFGGIIEWSPSEWLAGLGVGGSLGAALPVPFSVLAGEALWVVHVAIEAHVPGLL